MTKVASAPRRAPAIGFSVFFIHSIKKSASFKGSTAFSIVNNPKNSTPK